MHLCWRRVRDSNSQDLAVDGFQDRCNNHSANSPLHDTKPMLPFVGITTALLKAATGFEPANLTIHVKNNRIAVSAILAGRSGRI